MSTPAFELQRTSDGDVVIRVVDAERGCVIVPRRDVPALIEMLGRELEGLSRDPEDATTVRNLRPAT